jgi:flagellar protein FlgJ
MTIVTPAVAAAAKSPSSDEMRLRKTALQMEGVFVQRLFAAMRDTVPEGGLMDKSSAEDTFTQLFDEKLSEQAPSQWSGAHSLANALYNQLRLRLGSAEAASSNDVEAASTALHSPPLTALAPATDRSLDVP